MPVVKRKAFAYVTSGERLLVFSHPNAPEAGIQVPAGTIEAGERPADAVMREAREETGLDGLRPVRYLGESLRDMRDVGLDDVHHRYFFHLVCDGDPPARWRRHEEDASGGRGERPRFELFWAHLAGGVPALIADHGELLPRLLESLGMAEYRPSPRLDRAAIDLRGELAHVLWIGGPPDAGKSTTAAMIAERHGAQVYHFDRWEPRHIARCDPTDQPALYAFTQLSMDERWLLQTPEQMAADAICSWTERFWMAVDDLLAMPRTSPIVAEGPGFFPECVQAVIADPRQAIWLLPTRELKLASAARRDKPSVRRYTSDPVRATELWLARDLLLGEHVQTQARARDLAMLTVDGALPPEAMVLRLEHHFGSRLGARLGT